MSPEDKIALRLYRAFGDALDKTASQAVKARMRRVTYVEIVAQAACAAMASACVAQCIKGAEREAIADLARKLPEVLKAAGETLLTDCADDIAAGKAEHLH